jgi:transposase
MKGDDLRAARARFIEARATGQSWQQAVTSAGLPIRRAAAYNLERRFREQGESALADERHGHPSKLRDEPRNWLHTTCQEHPEYPANQIQQLLLRHFDLAVSTSQIRRFRKAFGLRYQSPKKR